jgi:hypothetical protein
MHMVARTRTTREQWNKKDSLRDTWVRSGYVGSVLSLLGIALDEDARG